MIDLFSIVLKFMDNMTQEKVNALLARAKTLVIIGVLILLSCFFYVNSALAHRPHSVIHKLELSPNYEQDKTVFIFVRDNLFKSSEEGKKWQRIVKGLDARYQLSDLVIFPKDKNILFLSSQGDGIYKSTDNGNSWSKVNQGLDNLKIEKLAISPLSPDIVLAAGTEKELYRTTDGGKTWSKVFDPKITAITFFPNENNKLMTGDKDGNLYRSEDEGQTWQKLNNLAKNGSGAITVIAFSPKFQSDNTFFLGTEKGGIYKTSDRGKIFAQVNQGISDFNIRDIEISKKYSEDSRLFAISWSEAVFESEDGGKTWKQHKQGIVKEPQADQFKVPHFYNLRMANNTMFLATFNSLFKSVDGGHTWQRLETLSKGTIVALAVSPNYANDSTVVLVNYVSMPYISRDKGVTWKEIDKGLELPRVLGNFKPVKSEQDPRRFFDVKFSPNYAQDKTLFAGLLWNKLIKTTDGGNVWNIITLPQSVRGISVVLSPNFASDKTVYVADQYRIVFKSTDGGETFTQIAKIGSQFSNESPSLVISPNFVEDKTLYLYINGEKGILKTVDGGKTWNSVTEGTPLMKICFIQLAISPNYKADQTVVAATGNGVFVTRDGSKTWVKLTNTAYGDDDYIEGVAISPNYQNDKTLIISVRGKGLYKTTDDGQNFNPIGNNSIAFAKMTYVPSSGIPIQFSPGAGQTC